MKASAALLEPAVDLPAATRPVALGKSLRILWQRILGSARRPARRLRLAESLSLGERRFVAVVEFEQSRFLVGGTPASLVLLARLEDRRAEDHQTENRQASEEKP